MIINIFIANSVFAIPALACFDSGGVSAQFFEIGDSFNGPPKDSRIIQLKRQSKEYERLRLSLQDETGIVIFHGLLGTNIDVAIDFMKIKHPNLKFGWVLYGTELQFAELRFDDILLPYTRMAYYKLKPLRHLLPLLKLLPKSIYRKAWEAIKYMDILIHFIPEEIQFFEAKIGIRRPSLWFTYGLLEDYVGLDLMDKYVDQTANILVGNSSSFTSNHLDFFKLVAGRIPNESKVFVPLSYGNKPYGKYVTGKGKELLGESFHPLFDFIPKNEYHELLLGCPHLVMNHKRQQGLGLIITALWMGAKVYLNPEVSTYMYFKRLGINIFTISNLLGEDESQPLELLPLPMHMIEENRRILLDNFGSKAISAKIHENFAQFQ